MTLNAYAECHNTVCVFYADCHNVALYAECRYAECHYAECHGALFICLTKIFWNKYQNETKD